MRLNVLLIVINLLVAALALLGTGDEVTVSTQSFPGWPKDLLGSPLYEVGLKPEEVRWTEGFPGKISRFTDGSREIVIRWVTSATRKLHPTADCLKALGYSIHPRRVRQDSSGKYWSCLDAFHADKNPLHVCEQIIDDSQQSWSDTSSWYWYALFRTEKRNYWAISVAERL